MENPAWSWSQLVQPKMNKTAPPSGEIQCTRCKEVKSEDEFFMKDKKKNTRQSHCKTCNTNNRRFNRDRERKRLLLCKP